MNQSQFESDISTIVDAITKKFGDKYELTSTTDVYLLKLGQDAELHELCELVTAIGGKVDTQTSLPPRSLKPMMLSMTAHLGSASFLAQQSNPGTANSVLTITLFKSSEAANQGSNSPSVETTQSLIASILEASGDFDEMLALAVSRRLTRCHSPESARRLAALTTSAVAEYMHSTIESGDNPMAIRLHGKSD